MKRKEENKQIQGISYVTCYKCRRQRKEDKGPIDLGKLLEEATLFHLSRQCEPMVIQKSTEDYSKIPANFRWPRFNSYLAHRPLLPLGDWQENFPKIYAHFNQ